MGHQSRGQCFFIIHYGILLQGGVVQAQQFYRIAAGFHRSAVDDHDQCQQEGVQQLEVLAAEDIDAAENAVEDFSVPSPFPGLDGGDEVRLLAQVDLAYRMVHVALERVDRLRLVRFSGGLFGVTRRQYCVGEVGLAGQLA
jgi:hypothetical protein